MTNDFPNLVIMTRGWYDAALEALREGQDIELVVAMLEAAQENARLAIFQAGTRGIMDRVIQEMNL